jgi:small redox-active disulfide protein 2
MKKIEILGTGCAKCEKLAEYAKIAADEMEINYELRKVQDIVEITSYGVMMTPGLAIDGKVVSQGKILTPDKIRNLLS